MGHPRRRISSKRLVSKKSYFRNGSLRIRVISKNCAIRNRLFRKLLYVTSKTGHFEIRHTTKSITSKKIHVDNASVRKKLLRTIELRNSSLRKQIISKKDQCSVDCSPSNRSLPIFAVIDFEVTHFWKCPFFEIMLSR